MLTRPALELVARLHRELGGRRLELLARRRERVARIAAGDDLDFLEETRDVRDDDTWRVAEPAPGLVDRRVEITGPTDRKMAINALNSGARVWLADLEDANTPLWENVVGGQLNLLDAVAGTLELTTPEGKEYRVTADETPTIVVRPRGWHLPEKHVARRRRAGVGQPVRLRAPPHRQRPGASSSAAAGRTSTCPRWSRTSRPGSGTTRS